VTVGLHGRVRTLEQAVRQRLGCPTCRGCEVVGLADGEPWPDGLTERGACRDCGRGVKVYAGLDLAAV